MGLYAHKMYLKVCSNVLSHNIHCLSQNYLKSGGIQDSGCEESIYGKFMGIQLLGYPRGDEYLLIVNLMG